MTAQMLDGRALAKEIRETLKQDFTAFRSRLGVAPTLAVLRIGDDEASAGYARALQKTCDGVGADFRAVELPASAQQAEVEEVLTELNTSPLVHGIMILEPTPDHISHPALIDLLNPAKDVDGVHPLNAGRLEADRHPTLCLLRLPAASSCLNEPVSPSRAKKLSSSDAATLSASRWPSCCYTATAL
jgi:methylenetetrahydrofolate dehydrogenase (NADP+)/methenyltetrahydrofolate cyclohydrolase